MCENIFSVQKLFIISRRIWNDKNGEMSEWSKEHAWKVCVLQKGTKGSNPFLSAFVGSLIKNRTSATETGKAHKCKFNYRIIKN